MERQHLCTSCKSTNQNLNIILKSHSYLDYCGLSRALTFVLILCLGLSLMKNQLEEFKCDANEALTFKLGNLINFILQGPVVQN